MKKRNKNKFLSIIYYSPWNLKYNYN
jgi:hypothetical protein